MTRDELDKYLTDMAHSSKIAHAIIIEGTNSETGSELSLKFAEALFGKPEHPDLTVITHEKPTNISVKEIREQLVDDIVIRPYVSNYKLYIINDAQYLGVQSQNAILKTLEEPPEYGIILMTTKAAEGLLETIRSRSLILSLSADKETQIDADALRKVTEFAGELYHLDVADADGYIKKLQSMVKDDGYTYAQIFDIIRKIYRDAAVAKAGGNTSLIPQASDVVRAVANACDMKDILDISARIDTAECEISNSVNVETTFKKLILLSKK